MTATAQTGPPHAPLGDHEEVPSDFEVLEIAVRELAIARGSSRQRTTASGSSGWTPRRRHLALALLQRHG